RAGAYRQGDAVVGDHAGEPFGDSPQLYRGWLVTHPGAPLHDGGRPAGGDLDRARLVCRAPRRHGFGSAAGRLRRYRDLTADDLLLVGVQLVLDVVDLAAGDGVADAVHLQVEDPGARRERTGRKLLDEREHRGVHPLEHRRDDHVLELRRDRVVLVGVHADGPLALGLRGLEHAGARAARGLVDHVGAGVVHAFGRGLALGRVIE